MSAPVPEKISVKYLPNLKFVVYLNEAKKRKGVRI